MRTLYEIYIHTDIYIYMNCQDIIKAESLYESIRFLFVWVCIENIICYEYYSPLAPVRKEIFDKQLFFWSDPFKPVTEILLNVQPLYFFVQMLYVQECTKGIVSIYRDTQWLKKITRLTIVQTNIFLLHAERLNYYSWQIQKARAGLGKTTPKILHFSS